MGNNIISSALNMAKLAVARTAGAGLEIENEKKFFGNPLVKAADTAGIPVLGMPISEAISNIKQNVENPGQMLNRKLKPEELFMLVAGLGGMKKIPQADLLKKVNTVEDKLSRLASANPDIEKMFRNIKQAGGTNPRISDYGTGHKFVEFEAPNNTTVSRQINELDNIDKIKSILEQKRW